MQRVRILQSSPINFTKIRKLRSKNMLFYLSYKSNSKIYNILKRTSIIQVGNAIIRLDNPECASNTYGLCLYLFVPCTYPIRFQAFRRSIFFFLLQFVLFLFYIHFCYFTRLYYLFV